MEDCIFCKIIKGEVDANKVYEDSKVLAFHDINPQAPVHILIIPKKHIRNLSDAGNEDIRVLGKIQLIAAKIAKKEGIFGAFRLMTANGQPAGQAVFHLHYHLLGDWEKEVPPMEGDPDRFP